MLGQVAAGALLALGRIYFLLLSTSVLPVAVAAVAGGRYSNCSSFATNGTAASQYAYYRFYDFRNISSDTWGSVQKPQSPNNATAGASTHDMSWQLDWARRDGLRYPGPDVGPNLLPIDYQPDSVYIDSSDDSAKTNLAFVSSRQSETSHQSSGIDFTDESILHLSLRLYVRVSGAPGACAAFFTYENDTQEADIELLTRDNDDVVGFNTQPTLDIHDHYVPDSHWNMSLPNNITRESWIMYRMDWVEDQVVWYVNGVHMANTTVNVPVEPSRLSIALWGNGGTWTGNMTQGESALLEVQWIEMVYNLSGASPLETGANAGSICNLDDGDDEGNWQPYIFPPTHSSPSGGHKLGMSALLMVFGIILGT
ncbi:concanavalin A-like lectin/glucanase domain-containing protein [Thelonectria olida]|uniref:Concanavalin A-like lectin/glucanase domain-containing protein n=1 Tax=Thelonectria olida TaxID=1576542 RepID=A0A9P9ALN0_9HYPO|nr:concanavalin A-like lectin/glucanase domain-containing protein [Thelonectria olida]